MHKDLMEIPQRIQELREILEISSLEMAKRLNISLDTYQKFESGMLISLSAHYMILREFYILILRS